MYKRYKMINKSLIFFIVIIGFCSCKKPTDNALHAAGISAENISSRPPQNIQKLDFTTSDTTIVFGDSWCDYRFQQNNFIKLFADSTGQKIINNAGIGLGSANMVAKSFEMMNETTSSKNIIALCGFNDVRYIGATTELLNFQKNAFRALLATQFTNEWRPAGAADRTGGYFTSFSQSLGLHFRSDYSSDKKAVYTSANNVFLEYDFTGTNIGVSFVGQDTTTLQYYERPHARWRVLIDGVVADTPQIHQQTYGHTPNYMAPQGIFPFIKIYSGLKDGPHVLRIESIEPGNKFIDFVFTLRDPSLVKPVAIMKIPYMTQDGYLIEPFFDKASDAAIEQVNATISSVRDEFIMINPGYSKKIKIINTADYFDRDYDYLPDLIHPNSLGQINLVTALKKHISY